MLNKSSNTLIGLLSVVIAIVGGASACATSVSSEATDAIPTESSSALSSIANGNKAGSGGQASGGQNSQGGNPTQNPMGSGVPQASITSVSTVHGILNSYNLTGITIIADTGQKLDVQLGNSSYIQSIGFAPPIGENVTVTGFPVGQGLYCAITIKVDSTGQVYTFRDETGRPLWAGGKGKGSK